MDEVIGCTGAVLPERADPGSPAERARPSSARLREQIHRALQRWQHAEREEGTDAGEATAVACVVAPRHVVLALARDGAHAVLAAAIDGGELTEDADVVLAAIELVSGADAALDDRVRSSALARAERWLAERAGAHAGGALAWRDASRRAALRRIAGLASHAPHHRRALLAPLAMAARRAVSAPYALGAERVLDELASAALPDEAWLRALASFAEVHGARAAEGTAARLIAVIVAG
jgi:hypothetical protein